VGKLALFALIMLATWILGRVIKRIVSAALDRHKGSSALLDKFIKKLIGRVIFFVGLLIGLSTLGVKVGAMLALIGGASFIVAFAMQDTLSNFANGVMLLLYQPFDVGVVVEVGGVTGVVDSVSLVNTTITTFDNKRVLVPNKSVWGQVITNITVSGTRRVDLVFGIGYGDDVDKAQAILQRLVDEHELVLEEPQPTIKVDELADSSVNFVVRPWVKTSDYGTVRWDLIRGVKLAFDQEGISIPFPQRDVHLIQESA
jgi:small conductance mechanosensitive channel